MHVSRKLPRGNKTPKVGRKCKRVGKCWNWFNMRENNEQVIFMHITVSEFASSL